MGTLVLASLRDAGASEGEVREFEECRSTPRYKLGWLRHRKIVGGSPGSLRRILKVEPLVREHIGQCGTGLGAKLRGGFRLDEASRTSLGLVGAILHIDDGIQR